MIDINKKYKWVGLDVHIYEIFEDKVFFRAKSNDGEWIGHSMCISLAIDQFKEV